MAALADPSTPVLAIIGDGSVHYTGQALYTAAQHRANLVVLILRNAEYAILKSFAAFENVGEVPGLDIPGTDPVAYAQAYGVPGKTVNTGPAAVRDAVLAALAAGGTHLIDVPIATAVPPLF